MISTVPASTIFEAFIDSPASGVIMWRPSFLRLHDGTDVGSTTSISLAGPKAAVLQLDLASQQPACPAPAKRPGLVTRCLVVCSRAAAHPPLRYTAGGICTHLSLRPVFGPSRVGGGLVGFQERDTHETHGKPMAAKPILLCRTACLSGLFPYSTFPILEPPCTWRWGLPMFSVHSKASSSTFSSMISTPACRSSLDYRSRLQVSAPPPPEVRPQAAATVTKRLSPATVDWQGPVSGFSLGLGTLTLRSTDPHTT